MKHLDEGTIVALRDGALVLSDVRTHAGECSVCAEALVSAEKRATTIARALHSIVEPVDVETAKARVRARLDGQRAAEVPSGRILWPLGRAALLLLVGAGAAYAIPGSPIREWLDPVEVAPSHGAASTVAEPQAVDDGGIEVGLRSGAIAISLTGVGDAEQITVTWVDEPVARISAPAGSSYGFAEGRAEVSVTAGPIRIEVDRAATSVVLEVNGRMVLGGPAANPRVTAEVATQTPDQIVFTLPQR